MAEWQSVTVASPFGDVTLEELVPTDGQRHVVGVWADEGVVLVEKEVDALGDLGLLLLLGEGREPLLPAAGVERVDEGQALHGMDAADGYEARRAEEDRADACLEGALGVLRENLRPQPDHGVVTEHGRLLPPRAGRP